MCGVAGACRVRRVYERVVEDGYVGRGKCGLGVGGVGVRLWMIWACSGRMG